MEGELTLFPAELPDPSAMGREELIDLRAAVAGWIARLDQEEPEDMDSEEYEAWGDRHEALEDLADDILDRLEELNGQ